MLQILKGLGTEGQNLAGWVLTYVTDRGTIKPKEYWIQAVQTHLPPQLGAHIMTLRKQWTLEGKAIGIEEGEKRGEERGIEKGKLDIAKKLLLTEHYSLSKTQELTGLSLEVLKQLKDRAEN